MHKESVLDIRNLHVHYLTDEETVKAVNGIDFSIYEGECFGLVGETGAGKTTTARAIMQLVPYPPGVITEGAIHFQGRNLIFNSEKENQQVRGNGISMIFQDPMTSLNPIMTIGDQLAEVVHTHQKKTNDEARQMVIEILETVGIKRDRYADYPHQFSGGMKQRAVIAMALLCRPQLLIADEPTTALDVTIQAQVLEIIKSLRERYGMAMLLITHDLGVVAETCERVAIMYAGEIVEMGSVESVYSNPRHPYTKGLFDSIPKLDEENDQLTPIPGIVPNAADLPLGCAFEPRCTYKTSRCLETKPSLEGKRHLCKCHSPLSGEETT